MVDVWMGGFMFLCVSADCFADDEGEGCFGEDGETTCWSEEAVDDGCCDRRVKAVDRSDFGEIAGVSDTSIEGGLTQRRKETWGLRYSPMSTRQTNPCECSPLPSTPRPSLGGTHICTLAATE
jgi:hypothetical protein